MNSRWFVRAGHPAADLSTTHAVEDEVRSNKTGKIVITVALAGMTFLTACNNSSSGNHVALNGAGSTFVYPIMGHWIEDFQQSHPTVRINYQSIGSGGGIQQVKSGTVDFGASDAPLSDAVGEWRRSFKFPSRRGRSA